MMTQDSNERRVKDAVGLAYLAALFILSCWIASRLGHGTLGTAVIALGIFAVLPGALAVASYPIQLLVARLRR